MKLVYIVPLFEMALGSKVSCLGCRQQQWFFSWSCLWRWNETEALLWLFIWKHHQKTFACACLFVQEEKSSPSNVFCEWISRDVTALMTTANSKSKYSNTAILQCHLLPPSPTGTSGEVSQFWSRETYWRLRHLRQDPGGHLGTSHLLSQLLSFKCAPSKMESTQWWMQDWTSAAACTPSTWGAQLPRYGTIIREVWFSSWLCKVLVMSFYLGFILAASASHKNTPITWL